MLNHYNWLIVIFYFITASSDSKLTTDWFLSSAWSDSEAEIKLYSNTVDMGIAPHSCDKKENFQTSCKMALSQIIKSFLARWWLKTICWMISHLFQLYSMCHTVVTHHEISVFLQKMKNFKEQHTLKNFCLQFDKMTVATYDNART